MPATLTGQLGKNAPRRGYRHRHKDRWVFGMLVGFMAISVAAIWFGQSTGIGVVKVDTSRPAAMRDIVLVHQSDDTVVVTDASSGDIIVTFGPGEGGFVRGSVRALDRMRLVVQAPSEAPYRLIRWEHGAVSLSDSVTGERLYLDAFGPDNAAAFNALLEGFGG